MSELQAELVLYEEQSGCEHGSRFSVLDFSEKSPVGKIKAAMSTNTSNHP